MIIIILIIIIFLIIITIIMMIAVCDLRHPGASRVEQCGLPGEVHAIIHPCPHAVQETGLDSRHHSANRQQLTATLSSTPSCEELICLFPKLLPIQRIGSPKATIKLSQYYY